MDHSAKLVIAAFFAAQGAFAHAFVFPAPPPGFGGTPGNWTFAPPPGSEQVDKIIRQSKSLPVPTGGSGTVKLSVSYKLKDSAAKVAAGVIFKNPYLRAGAAIAGWLITGKLMWDASEQIWREVAEPVGGEGFEYSATIDPEQMWYPSPEGACARALSILAQSLAGNPDYRVVQTGCTQESLLYDYVGPYDTVPRGSVLAKREATTPAECPTGWQNTPAGCLSPAVDQPKFEDLLSPNPMPQKLPGELPYPTPLPVEVPVVNPTPGPNPVPQTERVPLGDPLPIPNTDPQKYRQPFTDLVPSPSLDDPFRIDVRPGDKTLDSPLPLPNPETIPPDTAPDPTVTPKAEQDMSLCEKHPDIVACAKMDEVKPDNVNNEDKNLVITPESGWGNDNATCPAPVTKQVAGLNLEMSWQPFCDFASGIRPVVIAMAWLSAALFVLGVARKGD